MTIIHASLLCVAFGFIMLAVLAALRRRMGAHWYLTGVQIAVFLIVLNAVVFVVVGVASIIEGASS
jgi:hypothetical protein